eukprot:SAG31_NODE_10516_length_1129_cov_1.533981_1_plen_142_part_10
MDDASKLASVCSFVAAVSAAAAVHCAHTSLNAGAQIQENAGAHESCKHPAVVPAVPRRQKSVLSELRAALTQASIDAGHETLASAVRAIFSSADMDGNGRISSDELRAVLTAVEICVEPADIDALLRIAAADAGNGRELTLQ